jgi:hypothetical protein
MPLRWIRGHNPYRLNYFAILELGAHVNARQIREGSRNLVRKLGRAERRVDGRAISEAEVIEAESRLKDPAHRAAEALMVHPRPSGDRDRVPDLCAAVEAAATVEPSARPLRLTGPAALAPLVPPLHPAELPRPTWAELPVPAPTSTHDLKADVQFDL